METQKRFAPEVPNYIPGLGRGAVGFTTRSDIGPMRMAPDLPFGPAPAGYVSGVGRGAIALSKEAEGDVDRGDYSDTLFDKWGGFQGSLFANLDYDEEDEEADKIYSHIDNTMDGRRKVRRETRLKQEIEKLRKERPTIAQQFADLKRELAKVKREEWDSIPEIEDYTVKKKKYNRITPVPDSLIEQAAKDIETVNYIDPNQKVGSTPLGDDGALTSLTELGEARGQLLSLKLDKASDSVTGQSVVNTKGYLTSLNSLHLNNETEISDLKKARLLLKSVITNNAKSASGWIAAARVEELDGKLEEARNIIAQGCNNCLDSDDIWIEAARLSAPDKSRAILAKGIAQIPSSVKLWRAAAKKEKDIKAKSKVLKKALEYIPHSALLWKEAIELESEEEAKMLLYKAVECIPLCVDMWLALAKLETYENSRIVLNKARLAIPTDHTIWIHAAKLEEAQGNSPSVENIIRRAIKTLTKHGVTLGREQWLGHAENAELGGSIQTANAIIKYTFHLNLPKEDLKKTVIQNAKGFILNGAIKCGRAIYQETLDVFPTKKSLWMEAIQLEREHGSTNSLTKILASAVEKCSFAQIFHLMYAKHLWLQGELEACRELLQNARTLHSSSEEIILASVKFERENEEYEKASKLLTQARKAINSPKIWMQSGQLERELKNRTRGRELILEAIGRFPSFAKLWIIAAQIDEEEGLLDQARARYADGIRNCKTSPLIWVCAAAFEERNEQFTKARTILQQARIKLPKEPTVWLAAVRLENKVDNLKITQNLLSRALQECPKSGILWAEAIELEPLHQKKARSCDALKVCDQDEFVIVAVAKEIKIEKARKWLKRAVALNKDYGDAWAHYYKFELEFGDTEAQKSVFKKCKDAQPTHGELWCSISKVVENWKKKPEEILLKACDLITIS